MDVSSIFGAVILAFEALGVIVLIVGFVISFVLAARALRRGEGGAAFQTLRISIGASILLGLEIFVAGDIIRTIYMPTFTEAGILGLIVLIRTVLSMSIQIEIDGVLPWRRALLTSGGQLLANAVAEDARAVRRPRPEQEQRPGL